MRNAQKARSIILVFLCLLTCILGCGNNSSTKDKSAQTAKATSHPEQTTKLAKSADIATPQKTIPVNTLKEPKKEVDSSKILIKVEDWTLTIDEFNERIDALKQMVPDFDVNDKEAIDLIIEELIRQQLLVKEARKMGLDKDRDVVLAVEEFERTILVREIATKIVENVKVTEQEAKDYYNFNEEEFVSPGAWNVKEIVVYDEQEAKDILIELHKGRDFEEMAALKSKGETAKKGGDLGVLTEFDFPKMEKVIESLEVGDISGVFKGPKGFYIVKLVGKEGGEKQDFETIKKDIQEGLQGLKQQQKLLNYLEELRAKTPVDINEKLLEE